MHMRLLLLGSDNLLGQSLLQQGETEGITFHIPEIPEGGWKATTLKTVIEEVKPDCVINLAYYFDWFQARQVATNQLNKQITAVKALTKLCKKHSIILFQPSSYRVFGGSRVTAYTEEDEPIPISTLGQALWQIEQFVRDTCEKHVLMRFGWLIDYSVEGKVGRLLERAKRLPEIALADDRRGNPTPVDDAARVILAILQQLDCNSPLWGTYHYGGMEATSSLTWGQMALAEARQYQSELTEKIVAKPHTSFADATIEPQDAVLSCKKTLYTFGIKQRAWRTAIPELFKLFYQQQSQQNNGIKN